MKRMVVAAFLGISLAALFLFVLSGTNVIAEEQTDLRFSDAVSRSAEVGRLFPVGFKIANGEVSDQLEVTITFPVETDFSVYFTSYGTDGYCEIRGEKQICSLGRIVPVPPGCEIWVGAVLTATKPGTMVFTATVSGNEQDPNPLNNTRVLSLTAMQRIYMPLCARKG